MKLKNLLDKAKDCVYSYFEMQVAGLAAELSYYFLFSIFPLITVTGILSYTGESSAFVTAMRYFVPDVVHSIFEEYYDYVAENKSTVIFSFTLLISLYAIARYINRLKRKIREIFCEETRAGYLKEWLLSLAFSVFLVFGFYFTLTAQFISEKLLFFASENLFYIQHDTLDFIYSVRYAIVGGYVFLLLLMAYTYIPAQKIAMHDALPGALISTLAWISTSFVFSVYVDYFNDYTDSYGQMSAFLVLMLWIFILNNIVLAGAVINKVLFFRKKELFKKVFY